MIYLEAYLLAILAGLFTETSLSDIKKGTISNKSIVLALGAGIVCVICYYYFFAREYISSYMINVGIGTVIGLLLYIFGIWGAGDSKLLMATMILFPARIYCIDGRSVASCFVLISIVFIIAFAYTVIDTIYLGIKEKNLLVLPKKRIDLKGSLKGFLFIAFFLNIANIFVGLLMPKELLSDSVFLIAIHFVLTLIGINVERKASWRIVAAMGIIWGIFFIAGWESFNLTGLRWNSYVIVIVLMGYRMISSKYNYKRIHVSELKPGMILSIGSVLGFTSSKVKGLPKFTTEDLKSRLSSEEVESILRWSKTKAGDETIIIVRKIPFALFIALGTLIFAIMEAVYI